MAQRLTSASKSIERLRFWCLGAVVVTVIGFALSLVLGNLNQDEGWYLYAARQILRGEFPHFDFFFTQGSLMPLFYAAFAWLWSPMGILGGRLFTALLSLTALFIGSEIVAKSCRRPVDCWIARLALWSFLGLNLYHSYFTTIPKSYALCTLLLAVVFWLLSDVVPRRGMVAWKVALAGFLLALVADVRLSQGILLPTIGIWFLLNRKQVGTHSWLWFGVGGGVGLLCAFGPELLFCPEGFFAANSFHAQRSSMGLIAKVGSLARLIRFYPILTLVLVCLGVQWCTARGAFKRPGDRMCLMSLWLSSALALALVHLLAPVPYDDYQVPTMFPLGMVAALGFVALPFDSFKLVLVKTFAISAMLVTMAGSPMAQAWVVLRQDCFWMVLKKEPDLFALRRAAHLVREAVAQRHLPSVLWTQDTYLAVEAGMQVPRRLEMGPFGFTATHLSHDDFYLTRERLSSDETFENIGIAAWSGYTFLLSAPEMQDLRNFRGTNYQEQALAILRKTYPEVIAVIPDFGQQNTPLVIAVKP
ncbi:MAG: hypothetical protein RSD41_01540 [Kiritimatiellia bacterium]